MIVVIAEKPSVAKDLARILKAENKKDGYLEGNGYAVTWAYGHLVSLADPKDYGWEKWSKADLPMLPSPFNLVVNTDGSVKKQFNVIKALFDSCDSIIVATDAGREGELIFRYIYEACKSKKPFQRLWVSSLTDVAITTGFNNLKKGSDYDALYYAAKSRSESDWLVGMNATRAVTIASGSSTVVSLGRVQTPTLALICNRFIEHKAFVPSPFFTLKINLSKNEIGFVASCEEKFKNEEEAKITVAKLAPSATCSFVDVKEKIDKAPLLFDLSSLQQETNKKFGMSAQRTLDIAQELYETHKLLTYPRTNSNFISDDMYDGLSGLVENIKAIPEFSVACNNLLKEPLSKIIINNDKITDHHAIIPTDVKYKGDLSAEVDSVYKMVVVRFLSGLSKPCEKQITSYTFVSSGVFFKASGTVIKFAGWRGVELELIEEEDKTENQKLPLIEEKEVLPILKTVVEKKMTKAKPLLTEGSLLKLMETAGKDIDDKELRDAMRDLGLGTSATRAGIIETLYKREYISRDKKNILATEKGLALYHSVKDKSIANAEMTGEWERDLNHIASGNMVYSTFLENIRKYTADLVFDFFSKPIAGLSKVWGSCPKCSIGKMNDSSKTILCSNESCKFVIWKTISNKLISDDNLKLLLEKKNTALIKGFENKEKKQFDGILFLKEDFSIGLKFPEAIIYKVPCPRCKAQLEDRGKVLKCKNSECDFGLWKEVAGKKLAGKNIDDLLVGKTTDKIEGFESKAGKKFSAKLVLKDFKIEFVFDKK